MAMEDMDRCNCAPIDDVLSGRAEGTKDPCPVHPEPDLSDILPLLRPQRDCHGFGTPYDYGRKYA